MAQINIRMDDALKENLEQTCAELGMSMSTAFNIFARKVIREKRIPFDVSVDPFYTDANMARLADSLKQLSEQKTVSKSMEELENAENE